MRLRTATSGRLAALRESDPRYRALADGRPIPPAPPLPCVHRGGATGERECQSCGGNVRLKVHACAIHGACTVGKHLDGLACCRECPDRAPPAVVQAPAPARGRPAGLTPPLPPPPSVRVGVAVGTYGPAAASLVRLHARWLRRTCPGVPLLVCDDASPDAEAIARAAADEGASLWRSAVRQGHTAGDLAAVWKSLVWAHSLGLDVVVKLSQRLLPMMAGWATDSARELLGTGSGPADVLPVATARSDGPDGDPETGGWPLRTDCLVLAVARWTPDVLRALTPLDPAAGWRSWEGRYAECVVADLLRERLGGVYWPLSWLHTRRDTPGRGYLWHQSHGRADYERAAADVGLELPPKFTTAASGEMEDYQL